MVVIDQKSKTVTVIECSCPWVTNVDRNDKEKTEKYQEVGTELQTEKIPWLPYRHSTQTF